MHQVAGRYTFRQLALLVSQRQLLLVLDNLEQVVAAAPDLARLLDACPGLQVLATSREPLHLRIERRLPIGPLALPHARQSGREQAAAPAPSVALFTQRARAIQANFVLTEHNATTVGELCTRLDGLPLAIELAAARLSVLTPEALLARLERRLAFLQWRVADAPERHHALRTTFGWSYDLLDDADRCLLRRLGVFAGSFTALAARAVATPEASPDDCLDALQRLVDKSLIGVVETPRG